MHYISVISAADTRVALDVELEQSLAEFTVLEPIPRPGGSETTEAVSGTPVQPSLPLSPLGTLEGEDTLTHYTQCQLNFR